MNLDEIINGKRLVSAGYHILAARAWKHKGQDEAKQSPLIYAAFEYRCAIERVVLDLYLVMHNELPRTEDIVKIKSFSKLVTRVHKLAGGNKKLLNRVLKFNCIISELLNSTKTLSIPDVGKLHNYWNRLSEYCHRQIIPDKTVNSSIWINNGYILLNDVDDYLKHLLIDHWFGAMPENSMPSEVLHTKQAFVSEEIDEAALRIRLKLMEPVLISRLQKKLSC